MGCDQSALIAMNCRQLGTLDDTLNLLIQLNPYQRLQVARNADEDTIKRSFHSLLCKNTGQHRIQQRIILALSFDMLLKERKKNYKEMGDEWKVLKKDHFYYALTGNLEYFKSQMNEKCESWLEKFFTTQDECGRTVFYIAAKCGYYDLTLHLLQNGCVQYINNVRQCGTSPLHIAAQTGQKAIIKLLLSYGADPTLKNRAGKTPVEEVLIEDDHQAAYEKEKQGTCLKNLMLTSHQKQIQELYEKLHSSRLAKELKVIRNKEGLEVGIKLEQHLWNPAHFHRTYHGTKFANLERIVKHGLKKPGNFVDHKQIKINEAHFPLGLALNGIKDWAKAVFVSPNIFYAADAYYAERIMNIDQQYACVVEVFVPIENHGIYSVHNHTWDKYMKSSMEPQHIEYQIKLKENQQRDEHTVWRVEDEHALVIGAVFFLNVKYLETVESYDDEDH